MQTTGSKFIGHCDRRVSRRASHVALSLVLVSSAVANAQEVAPAGVVNAERHATVANVAANVRDERRKSIDMVERIGLGMVGAFGGSYAGAEIGYRTAAGCHGEWCSINNTLTGAGIGAVVGSTILSAFPRMGSKCGTAERIGTSMALSLAGALVGGFVGGAAGPGVGLVGFAMGTSVGAGVGASICT